MPKFNHFAYSVYIVTIYMQISVPIYIYAER